MTGQKADGESLATIAYEAVLSQIMEGGLAGDRVIREVELANALGLSRTPVREALGRLEGEGLIVRNGRVLTVRKLSITDYLEILHLRKLLECETVRLACGRISKRDLLDIRKEVEALEDPLAVTPQEHWAVDDLVHITIAGSVRSQLLSHLVVDLRKKTRLFGIREIPARFFPGREEHLEIIDALIEQDETKAVAAMARHIDNVKASILATIQDF